MPILGVLASGISGHLFNPTGSYTSIATATVDASGANTITFTSIPSTYTHLQIRWLARSAGAFNGDNFKITFNSDTASNYTQYHEILGDGSTAAAYNATTSTFTEVDQFAGGNKAANIFGAGVIDILDYTNVNKNKVIRALSGYDANGTGAMVFGSGMWRNSSTAISSITFTTAQTGTPNFAQYTQLALYGIK